MEIFAFLVINIDIDRFSTTGYITTNPFQKKQTPVAQRIEGYWTDARVSIPQLIPTRAIYPTGTATFLPTGAPPAPLENDTPRAQSSGSVSHHFSGSHRRHQASVSSKFKHVQLIELWERHLRMYWLEQKNQEAKNVARKVI